MKRKRRIIPVFRKGKEHEGHADGFVIHPDDREVRKLPKPEEKQTETTEAPDGG